MFQGTSRRVVQSAQRSLVADPLAQLLVDVAAVLPPTPATLSEQSRLEHARLREELRRIVEAAPIRRVGGVYQRGPGEYELSLECGHVAEYFALREQLHCHQCVGHATPTRGLHG